MRDNNTASRRAFLKASSGTLAGLGMLGALGANSMAVAQNDGAPAEPSFTLATMPRIDVHGHILAKQEILDGYMALRKSIKEQLDVEMAMWISLGSRAQDLAALDLPALHTRHDGRFRFCIYDYVIEDGLRFSPEELAQWHSRGAAGLKFYPGWGKGVQIDAPEFTPVFEKMEELGMVAASPHVTNPCGTFGRRSEWFDEPVEFWRQQRAWEAVLKRHPRMTVVNAHMLWLCYSDEQLDVLRYMLSTYPNLNIDLATTPVFWHALTSDSLRDFMIEYSDRILFGTDVGSKWFVPELDNQFPNPADKTPQYKRYFTFLETDQQQPSGIQDEKTFRGLALPLDVLEKIYFRNAMRIYPNVRDVLGQLGYLTKKA
ncbi:MAG: amidohydrolase family protein [Patescibacteria group bacterium]|nr:amidohydrolase family protein [Patescibacteria group bacterium]